MGIRLRLAHQGVPSLPDDFIRRANTGSADWYRSILQGNGDLATKTNNKERKEPIMRIETGQTIAGLADYHYSAIEQAKEFEEKFEEYFCGFSNVWLWIRDSAIAFDNQLIKLLGNGPYDNYLDYLGKYAELISLESMKMEPETFCETNWEQWFNDKAEIAIRERGGK